MSLPFKEQRQNKDVITVQGIEVKMYIFTETKETKMDSGIVTRHLLSSYIGTNNINLGVKDTILLLKVFLNHKLLKSVNDFGQIVHKIKLYFIYKQIQN